MNIDNIKKRIFGNPRPRFIFDKYFHKKELIYARSEKKDRYLEEVNARLTNENCHYVDSVFSPMLRRAFGVLNTIERYLSSDGVTWSIEGFSRIVSTNDSTYQPMHLDFAPQNGSNSEKINMIIVILIIIVQLNIFIQIGWKEYFSESRRIGITPLSLLAFPEGGHFVYMPADLSIAESNMEAFDKRD